MFLTVFPYLARHDRAARLVLWQAQLSETTPGAGAKEPGIEIWFSPIYVCFQQT